jgi:uncharacterized protein
LIAKLSFEVSMKRFAIFYTPGTSWKTGQPWNEQGLYAHGVYMNELFSKGTLLYGGPFDNHTGGLAIVEIESVDEVETIIQQDPAVKDGIFVANAHPWITVFDQPNKTNLFKKKSSEGEAAP